MKVQTKVNHKTRRYDERGFHNKPNSFTRFDNEGFLKR